LLEVAGTKSTGRKEQATADKQNLLRGFRPELLHFHQQKLYSGLHLIALTIKHDYLTAVPSASGEHEKQKEESYIKFSRKFEINFGNRGMTSSVNFFHFGSRSKILLELILLLYSRISYDVRKNDRSFENESFHWNLIV
jgi:hypothetical protein